MLKHKVAKLPLIANAGDQAVAAQIALQWQLLYPSENPQGLALEYTNGQLSLVDLNQPKMGGVCVDFASDAMQYRQKQGSIKNEAIAKAIGLKGNKSCQVLDATAGLGRDSFVLASLGANVTLLERSNVVAALLDNGLSRALQDSNAADIASRMALQFTTISALAGEATQPQFDAVYLDPMFPHKKKTALVKKEMRLLQQLLGADEDASELLEPALALASNRVVVKRPDYAPYLADKTPSMQIKSKKHRFDVYLL